MKHILAGALALSVFGGGVASAQSYDQDQYQSNPYYQDQGYGYDRGQEGGEYRDPRFLGPPERQYDGRDPYDRGDRWGRGGYRYRYPYRYHHHRIRRVCRWEYNYRVCHYVR